MHAFAIPRIVADARLFLISGAGASLTQHGIVPRLIAINQLSINLTDIQYPLCTNGGN
jgi:hypothetical protein